MEAQKILNQTKPKGLQIARTYLSATDPEISKRTWSSVMDETAKTKTGVTLHRHHSAMKDAAFDLIRNMPILETQAVHFLRVMETGCVCAPDTTLLVSGAPEAFTECRTLLQVFGGNMKCLGHEIGAAATLDLSSLSYVYGAMVGVLHGACILEAEGLGLTEYATLLSEVAPSFGLFLKHEVSVIHSGNFAITESPLRISVEATARLLHSAHAAKINEEFPALAASLFQRAKDAGYNDEEAAAVIKVLRAS